MKQYQTYRVPGVGKWAQTYKGKHLYTPKRGEPERMLARLLMDEIETKFPVVFAKLYSVYMDRRKNSPFGVHIQFRCNNGLMDWCCSPQEESTPEALELALITRALTGISDVTICTDYPHQMFVEDDEYEAWANKQRETVE